MFCCYSSFVVFCIFIFVCTSVGLLPLGESPIAVNNNNNNNNNNNETAHRPVPRIEGIGISVILEVKFEQA
jgi:hypothetical protein